MLYVPIFILTTDGTIGCVMSGRCLTVQVMWQMLRLYDSNTGHVLDVTQAVPPGAHVGGTNKDHASPCNIPS